MSHFVKVVVELRKTRQDIQTKRPEQYLNYLFRKFFLLKNAKLAYR